MAKKKVERKVTEDPRYHNTWKLLKKYRDVVWSLELSVQQVRTQFQIEYDTSIEDFPESIYLAGAGGQADGAGRLEEGKRVRTSK